MVPPWAVNAVRMATCSSPYATDVTAAPASPSVARAMERMLTADGLPSAHCVLTAVSASSSACTAATAHTPHSAAEEGTKPLLAVTAGRASTPAPTVVPATSAAAAIREPGRR